MLSIYLQTSIFDKSDFFPSFYTWSTNFQNGSNHFVNQNWLYDLTFYFITYLMALVTTSLTIKCKYDQDKNNYTNRISSKKSSKILHFYCFFSNSDVSSL